MSETLWCLDNRFGDGFVMPLETATDLAEEELLETGRRSCLILECRKPSITDFPAENYVNEIIEFLGDMVYEDDEFMWEDGNARLDEPSAAVKAQLTAAIQAVLDNALDLSEAAWPTTGRTMEITLD